MPKPIVLQNRTWLFWACYIFDSVHHVIRGQLAQIDDHFLEAQFPALTELDHDEGLWTRWFMLKEINLWRIGRKVHSYFQSQLKEKDRLVEASKKAAAAKQQQKQSQDSTKEPPQPAYFLNLPPEDILSTEYSEAELVLSLKLWTDDLPARLMAQTDPSRLERVDPRVNGRAVGLQAIYTMLRILLLYPNMLLIGTDLLATAVPASPSTANATRQTGVTAQSDLFSSPMEMTLSSSSVSSSTPSVPSPLTLSSTRASSVIPRTPHFGATPLPNQRSGSISAAGTPNLSTASLQLQIAQQQHYMRRQDSLDKIMQCVQEADRLVMWSTLILERYPERAMMACLGAGLDWCLRIYDKVLMENRNVKSGSEVEATVSSSSTFSPRLRSRCRGQVSKVTRLLQMLEDLDHRHYYSWLTTDLESLQDRQKAAQQKMIARCLQVDKGISAGSGKQQEQQQQQQQHGVAHHSSSQQQSQQQQPQLPVHDQVLNLQEAAVGGGEDREKMHGMESIIRKRRQMGVYAMSGIQPNGGLPYGSGIGSQLQTLQQQQQQAVLSDGFAFSGVNMLPISDGLPLFTASSGGVAIGTGGNMYRDPSDHLMLSALPFSTTHDPQHQQPIYHFEYETPQQSISNSSSSTSSTSMLASTYSHPHQQQFHQGPLYSTTPGFGTGFYPQGLGLSNTFTSTATTSSAMPADGGFGLPVTATAGGTSSGSLNFASHLPQQQQQQHQQLQPAATSSMGSFFG